MATYIKKDDETLEKTTKMQISKEKLLYEKKKTEDIIASFQQELNEINGLLELLK